VAHSDKYGGVAYPGDGLATASAGHEASVELLLHEIGHALADLADEYWQEDTSYSGPEPPYANVTKLDPFMMDLVEQKWHRWLGVDAECCGGLHDAYMGGHHHESGLRRPTPDSRMRMLFRPFNLPSTEALVLALHRFSRPIDASRPGPVATPIDTLWVDVVPTSQGLTEVRWRVDATEVQVEVTTGRSNLWLPGLDLAPGPRTITARVADETWWVRDEAARDAWMTETRTWTVLVPGACPEDVDGDGHVGFLDLLQVIGAWGPCPAWCPTDLDHDGTTGLDDLLEVITDWGGAC